VVGGKRYLFFVVQQMLVLDEVALAAAYGVPCEVLDEKVMIALQVDAGLYPHCGFIRAYHQTQKILTRPLKRQHFNLERFPDLEVWYRQRGDTAHNRPTDESWDALKKAFQETRRKNPLYAGG
jgi:hypothetical protein